MSRIQNKKLKEEILVLVKRDQNLRLKQWKKIKKDNKILSDSEIKNLAKELEKIDRYNVEIMKKIVYKHGWPTIPMVGRVASNGAWLIVQHVSNDKNFQRFCLTLLEKAYKKNLIRPSNFAYLKDRILVLHEHKKQIYGTQFRGRQGGKFKPFPIRDIKNLNKRRSEVGLDTFEKYSKRINSN